MTSVDVVVPCYNYAQFLPRCVSSIVDQQGADLRVLIIDDASSDDTPQVGQRLAALDPRIEFRRHEVNRGHIATYNEGLLGWAQADYSLLISADDLLTPGALARAARLMDQHPDVAFTYGRCWVIGEDVSAPLPRPVVSDEYQIISSKDFLRQVFQGANIVPTPTAVVRTRWQKEIGGYKAELPHSGDMEMWLRFSGVGQVGVLRSTQAYYRSHPQSMSAAYYARAVGDRRERIDAYRATRDRSQSIYPELTQWYSDVCRRLAEECLWMAGLAFERGDQKSADECAAFAFEAWPSIRWSGPWLRFLAKRALGQKGVRSLRRIFRVPAEEAAGDNEDDVPFQRGWWPSRSPLRDVALAASPNSSAGIGLLNSSGE